MALIANIFSSVGRGAIVEYCAKHRFPVVSFLSFLLIFFSFFVGGKKRKNLSERFSSTMEKLLFFSFLFFLDESPDSGSTVFRINFSFDLGRLVDNRDLICSLYIYTRI